MFIKKIAILVFSLSLIFATFSVSRASFNYADNNRYQPTIVLSGDLDSNSFFMAGWGSKFKKAFKKVVDKVKKITFEKPKDSVGDIVDGAKKIHEINEDIHTGDPRDRFGNLKEDIKDDAKDVKDRTKEIGGDVKDVFKDSHGAVFIDDGGDSDGASGGGDGGTSTPSVVDPDRDNPQTDPCFGLSGPTLDSCRDDISNSFQGNNPVNPPLGVDSPATQDSLLTNPFEDLEKKMKDVKAQILNSFSSFGEVKQERISKLTVLVGERRASDIDLGIQNITGKFSNLLSRIIDFNSNITRGSKDFFASNPNPATEKDVVLKLRFAFEQIKNSNSLIDRLREVYLDIIKAESEKDLQIRYEKNLKPLFIQTSTSIKDTYFYIEKIAKMMREISKNK
ncbi:MAG: hypothetical protein EXS49_00365 [Candidatus Pacebacteria bacterium]|nr:hypothetical protein [Candidatus Paceibacterota bacterium]